MENSQHSFDELVDGSKLEGCRTNYAHREFSRSKYFLVTLGNLHELLSCAFAWKIASIHLTTYWQAKYFSDKRFLDTSQLLLAFTFWNGRLVYPENLCGSKYDQQLCDKNPSRTCL